MRRGVLTIVVLAFFGLAAWAWRFGLPFWRGAEPAFLPPVAPSTTEPAATGTPQSQNLTGLPLKLPEGFSISTFAKDLPGARVLAFDSLGNGWVSQTSEGTVTNLEVRDGKVVGQQAIFRSLNRPHGLAFDPKDGTLLYLAEETKLSKVQLYSDGRMERVADLPGGGRHYTRSLGFGPDGRLYVSAGSTCDVCHERDGRVAKMFSLGPDGSDWREEATGLRNSVFFAWRPQTAELWATEMGRDNLGDDLPPDEINVIERGGDYGWPLCFGQNVHDAKFDRNVYIQNPCQGKLAPRVELPAHSAPLGLAFVPKDAGWPESYGGDLLVALHGSWNRSTPVGYRVVRVKLDGEGRLEGTEDFLSGWLEGRPGGRGGALGRPVGLTFGSDGALYVTDDKAGAIYRVWYGHGS